MSGVRWTKWPVGLMQVGSRFRQENSSGHGGQVHVWTRPLGWAISFLSCGSCDSTVSTWSGKCLLGPGLIDVRTNWAYRLEGQGSFRTKMGGFRDIPGSNSDYPGSYCRTPDNPQNAWIKYAEILENVWGHLVKNGPKLVLPQGELCLRSAWQSSGKHEIT